MIPHVHPRSFCRISHVQTLTPGIHPILIRKKGPIEALYLLGSSMSMCEIERRGYGTAQSHEHSQAHVHWRVTSSCRCSFDALREHQADSGNLRDFLCGLFVEADRLASCCLTTGGHQDEARRHGDEEERKEHHAEPSVSSNGTVHYVRTPLPGSTKVPTNALVSPNVEKIPPPALNESGRLASTRRLRALS